MGGTIDITCDGNGKTLNYIRKIKNTEKVTNPGNKTVYRLYSKSTGKIKADLICLADEKLDADQNMVLFDPIDTWKKTKVLGGTYEVRELLIPVIKEGKRVYNSSICNGASRLLSERTDTLWDESRRFVNPQKVYVDLSSETLGSEKRPSGRNK